MALLAWAGPEPLPRPAARRGPSATGEPAGWRRGLISRSQARRAGGMAVRIAFRLRPSGLIRIRRNLDERSDQAKQGLLFRLARSVRQESSQLDMTALSSGGPVRLVNDECPAVLRLSAKVPSVPARASVEFSAFRHQKCLLAGPERMPAGVGSRGNGRGTAAARAAPRGGSRRCRIGARGWQGRRAPFTRRGSSAGRTRPARPSVEVFQPLLAAERAGARISGLATLAGPGPFRGAIGQGAQGSGPLVRMHALDARKLPGAHRPSVEASVPSRLRRKDVRVARDQSAGSGRHLQRFDPQRAAHAADRLSPGGIPAAMQLPGDVGALAGKGVTERRGLDQGSVQVANVLVHQRHQARGIAPRWPTLELPHPGPMMSPHRPPQRVATAQTGGSGAPSCRAERAAGGCSLRIRERVDALRTASTTPQRRPSSTSEISETEPHEDDAQSQKPPPARRLRWRGKIGRHVGVPLCRTPRALHP
ncbi:hypothetical protein M446_3610 [Methylobacterium sp. 4-46]|nr:hypothetical protein M446_3610 [Methylobacterium sp. 4-46]